MPEDRKEWIKLILNVMTTIVVAFVVVFVGVRQEWFQTTEDRINQKADVSYVDKQDNEIRQDLNDFKREVNEDNEQMIRYQELMMKFWGIAYEDSRERK